MSKGKQMADLIYEKGNSLVTIQNALVEASYDLSVSEIRLLMGAMSKVPPDVSIDSRDWLVCNVSDLEKAGDTKSNAYRQITEDSLEKLFRRYISFREQDEEGYVWARKTRWIQDYAFCESQGKKAVKIRLSQSVVECLDRTALLEQFTKIGLRELQGLSSQYAIRLYMILSAFKNAKSRKIAIHYTDLRGRMEVGERYKKYAEFKRGCILAAIEQINKAPYTKFRVTFRDDEKGCKVGKSIQVLHFYLREPADPLLSGDLFNGTEPVQIEVHLSTKQRQMYARYLTQGASVCEYAKKSGYTFINFYMNAVKDGMLRSDMGHWKCVDIQHVLEEKLDDPTFAFWAYPFLKKVGFKLNYKKPGTLIKVIKAN